MSVTTERAPWPMFGTRDLRRVVELTYGDKSWTVVPDERYRACVWAYMNGDDEPTLLARSNDTSALSCDLSRWSFVERRLLKKWDHTHPFWRMPDRWVFHTWNYRHGKDYMGRKLEVGGQLWFVDRGGKWTPPSGPERNWTVTWQRDL